MRKSLGRFRPRHPVLGRPGRGWLCPLRSGISGGNKFIGQQAISRPNGGRSWVTNPTQSMANVVNHDPRCCCSGHISLQVEIEMRAGNISTDAPCPCHVMPTRTKSPWYSHSISSSLIAILLAKNVSTYRDGGKIGHGWRPHRWLPCHDERIFATDDISDDNDLPWVEKPHRKDPT